MAVDAESDPFSAIGQRIRDVRTARKLSLRDVGAKADVTASFLSQVERGQVQPSIVTLHRICSVLGMSMSEALAVDEPRGSGVAITRHDKRGQMIPPSLEVTVDMLVTAVGRAFEMLLVKLAPGMATGPDLVSHDAHEAMFIVSGTARFESESTTTELQAGDTIYLNSTHPHRMVNIGPDELVFVDCIVGAV